MGPPICYLGICETQLTSVRWGKNQIPEKILEQASALTPFPSALLLPSSQDSTCTTRPRWEHTGIVYTSVHFPVKMQHLVLHQAFLLSRSHTPTTELLYKG